MAKSGQKRKKAEKAKTQLKASMKAAGRADRKKKVKGQSGIRLPKGLNESKPEVKTKTLAFVGLTAPLERTAVETTVQPSSSAAIATKVKKYRPLKVGHLVMLNGDRE